jgi:hypothetical protein
MSGRPIRNAALPSRYRDEGFATAADVLQRAVAQQQETARDYNARRHAVRCDLLYVLRSSSLLADEATSPGKPSTLLVPRMLCNMLQGDMSLVVSFFTLV